MKIQNLAIYFIIISTLCLRAQVTISLSDREIKAHTCKREKIKSIPGGNFYPRKYHKIPGDDLREKLDQKKNLKWALSEAIVNTVVRTLTRGLRQDDGIRKNRIVVWKADRDKFRFEYRAVVKNSTIVREECTLKFPGISVMKTRNGKMQGAPNISRRDLVRAIKILEKSDLKVEQIRVGVCCKNDINKTDQMLDYLNINENSTVYISCRNGKTVPEVKIKFKQ